MWTARPGSGVARPPLSCPGGHISNSGLFFSQPVAAELATALGSMMYMAQEPIWVDGLWDLTPGPYEEEKEEL